MKPNGSEKSVRDIDENGIVSGEYVVTGSVTIILEITVSTIYTD